MTAYYNEIDPYAAEWLNNLILEGAIAPGIVDTRSIEDVTPGDLAGFTQCHFFAGIGGWSLALRMAGWPDERPVWTGSCPCQPFSAAGKGKGTADERHLWPAWYWLIAQCHPRVVFGEQVEAAIKHAWLDLVQADLEGIGYAVAPVGLPAASVGAPHGRARLWFVADDDSRRRQVERRHGLPDGESQRWRDADGRGAHGSVGHAERIGTGRDAGASAEAQRRVAVRAVGDDARPPGAVDDVGHADDEGSQGRSVSGTTAGGYSASERSPWAPSTLEWLPCRDGKARPTEPGLFPLAHGVSARVGRLRAYGNAIVPQVAAEVIRAYVDARS
jgi:DNA (cytosine-5)-methyltransferase 1